jgi:hypothetical protein
MAFAISWSHRPREHLLLCPVSKLGAIVDGTIRELFQSMMRSFCGNYFLTHVHAEIIDPGLYIRLPFMESIIRC